MHRSRLSTFVIDCKTGDLDASARKLPGPQEVWDSLGLDEDAWELVRLDTALRAVSHGDEHATMDDAVVVARRRVRGAAQPSSSDSAASSRSTSSVSV